MQIYLTKNKAEF